MLEVRSLLRSEGGGVGSWGLNPQLEFRQPLSIPKLPSHCLTFVSQNGWHRPRLYGHCLTSASQNGWHHRCEVQDTREEHMFFTLCTRVTIPLKIFFLQKG